MSLVNGDESPQAKGFLLETPNAQPQKAMEQSLSYAVLCLTGDRDNLELNAV